MVEPLPKEKLKSVYNRVASWYDWQHAFFTANSDQTGRKLLLSKTVKEGDTVIDAGAGTGSTALMAAEVVGPDGLVTLYDLSKGMLEQARQKATRHDLADRLLFEQGDLLKLPHRDKKFDVALSTYSMCPVHEPSKAALELHRVVKPGGKIGIAHSTEPSNPIVKKLAKVAEKTVRKIPELSLGCRPVEVLPTLKNAGDEMIFAEKVGVPLWPFLVFVVEKSPDDTV